MEQTLLLSAGYEPIKVISWQKAVTLVFLDKVEILEEYDRPVRSPSVEWRLPSVVKLVRYIHHMPRRVKFSRQNLYQRDNFTCQYCKRAFAFHQLTYDHIVPRSRGGKTSWTNVVTACVRCNRKKGNKLLSQLNVTLANEPVEPTWLVPYSGGLSGSNAPHVWRPYLAFADG